MGVDLCYLFHTGHNPVTSGLVCSLEGETNTAVSGRRGRNGSERPWGHLGLVLESEYQVESGLGGHARSLSPLQALCLDMLPPQLHPRHPYSAQSLPVGRRSFFTVNIRVQNRKQFETR